MEAMNKPTENAPITDVLAWYAENNMQYGKRLAKYLDFLEDCFSYTLNYAEDDDY